MKKLFLCLIVFCIIFSFSSCAKSESADIKTTVISALSENPLDYKENNISSLYTASKNASVKKIYYKDNNYILYSVGNFGYNGPVALSVLIIDGIIVNIKGFNIKETEGYGARAFEDSFLNQFENVNVNDIELFIGSSKPTAESDIIYVTHATRSSTAITSAVNEAVKYYKTYIFTID